MPLCSSAKNDGIVIDMNTVVLVVHFRNNLDVLLHSGMKVTIRQKLSVARDEFQRENIPVFEPCSSTIVVWKYIEKISQKNTLVLSKKIRTLLHPDLRTEYDNITVPRRRRKAFADRKKKLLEQAIAAAAPPGSTAPSQK